MRTDAFNRIFKFDKRIRYCGAIDQKWNLIAGTLRKGIESLEPELEDSKLFLNIALLVSMDRSWDRYFGRTKVLVIVKEKVTIFIYSLSSLRAILLAVEPDFPITKLNKLGEILDTSNLQV